MITSKCISTISYNSDFFLVNSLNAMISDFTIEFYAFIRHEPEDDEKKSHIHLFIVPSGRLDTNSLLNRLREPDLTHPDNPLGCIRFVGSKFADWYLYAIHDPDYLVTKCECRKYRYGRDDIIVSDHDYFVELIHTSDFQKFKTFAKFRDMCKSGVSFQELFEKGFIPVQQIVQYEKAYNLMTKKPDSCITTYRNGRAGHEDPRPTRDDFDKLLQGLKRDFYSDKPFGD